MNSYPIKHQDPTVIVVLGNLMKKDGTLNKESASRVSCAVNAANQNDRSIIVTCGWAYRKDSLLTIAEAMKSHIGLCYPEVKSSILCQNLSRDTVGDAVFTRLMLQKVVDSDISKLLIVTSDYHVARSKVIFDFVFGAPCECLSAPSRRSQQIRKSEMRSLEAFRNTFAGIETGDIKQIVSALISRHPFYNGQVHRKISLLVDIDFINL